MGKSSLGKDYHRFPRESPYANPRSRMRATDPASYTDYDICLMLTEIFGGQESAPQALNLYKICKMWRRDSRHKYSEGDENEADTEETT